MIWKTKQMARQFLNPVTFLRKLLKILLVNILNKRIEGEFLCWKEQRINNKQEKKTKDRVRKIFSILFICLFFMIIS